MPQEDDSRLRCDVLSAWASITQEKQRRQANRRRAVRFHYFKLLRQGFEAFRYPIQTQQERIQVLNRVSEKKLQARCFYAWLQHVRTRQVQARQELQARQNQLQLAFYQWKALHLKRIQDERDERTTAHFHRNKVSQIFISSSDALEAHSCILHPLESVRQVQAPPTGSSGNLVQVS
ncbi:unnamed protein product [Aphanomyces euteiches]